MRVLATILVCLLLALAAAGQQQSESAKSRNDIEILTDTTGVDFQPYLGRVLKDVRTNWFALIPEAARAPQLKQGKVTIQFAIEKDGHLSGIRITESAGDVALDRAAWGGVTSADPLPPLPPEFRGPRIVLRFHFYYNPQAKKEGTAAQS